MKKYRNALILFGLIAGNVMTASGALLPVTIMACAVAAMAWPILDLLEAAL